jgi:glyoxylase-like metal-dependent hydrolase (beta-lactamase superfamily II)
MSTSWTRRDFLTRAGVAVAAIEGFDHFGACCAMAADAKTANDELFELKPVADGIYAAVAAPRYKVNSNAAVILTDDGVIVVDSHSKPSAALALYREIQAITRQPIKRIINTHFHWDHWQGNQIYAEAFPGIEIIASRRTSENMTDPNAGGGGIPYIDKQLEGVPKEIDKLKAEIARASSAAQKSRLESNLSQAEAYLAELKQIKPALPNRTFADSVTLQVGGREIQLLLLGRGHTDGDVFIHLPKEKVVVTGDALIDWMPYMNDGFPEEWVRTLGALGEFDFTRIIPGHGDVLQRDGLTFFRSYLADLVDAVRKAGAEGATLEDMQRTLPDKLAPKYERGMSKYPMGQYRERISINIEATYRKVIAKG